MKCSTKHIRTSLNKLLRLPMRPPNSWRKGKRNRFPRKPSAKSRRSSRKPLKPLRKGMLKKPKTLSRKPRMFLTPTDWPKLSPRLRRIFNRVSKTSRVRLAKPAMMCVPSLLRKLLRKQAKPLRKQSRMMPRVPPMPPVKRPVNLLKVLKVARLRSLYKSSRSRLLKRSRRLRKVILRKPRALSKTCSRSVLKMPSNKLSPASNRTLWKEPSRN